MEYLNPYNNIKYHDKTTWRKCPNCNEWFFLDKDMTCSKCHITMRDIDAWFNNMVRMQILEERRKK
jgi:uncharacterized paraquat-inducible protein A